MKKIRLVMQMKQTECGLCVAQMILNYYGAMVSLSELNEKLEVGRDGISIKKLKGIFNDFGLKTAYYKISIENIDKSNYLTPFIALSKEGHYIIVEKITKRGVYVVDPAVGKRKIEFDEFKEKYLETVLQPIPEENFTPFKKNKKDNIFLECLKSNKKAFSFMFIISLLVYGFMFVLPQLSSKVIRLILNNLDGQKELLNWIQITSVAFIAYMMITFVKSKASVNLSVLLDKFLSELIIDKLFKNDLKFFLQRTSADLQYRFNLLRGIKVLLNEIVVSTVLDAGALFVILVYVLIVAPKYSVILIISTLVIIVLKIFLKEKILLYKNEETASDTGLQILQNDLFRSIADIKVLGLQKEKKQQWSIKFKEYIENHKRYEFLMSMYKSVLSSMNLFIPIFTTLLGAWYISFTGNISEVAIIISLQTILGLYLTSLLSISEIFDHVYLIQSYMLRIDDIMSQKDEGNGNKLVDFKGNIKVNNLSFKYVGDENYALSDINLEIKEGEKIAFTGCTGSGKSTLLNILVGLFKDYSGSMLIENVDVEDIDDKCFRNQISVVPQNSLLFNGTLKENLDITGRRSEEEIYKALDIVALGVFVRNLPMKLNTIVAENGFNFSGGQRQRIALARAIINSGKVIFLDEATSALDNVTESKIVSYFKQNNSTQVIVAHRLSTIIDADRIYVLKEGKIVEFGSHNELMKLGGEYSKLYKEEERDNELFSSTG